jgi:hypothetical protein
LGLELSAFLNWALAIGGQSVDRQA